MGFHRVDRERIVEHVLETYPLLMKAYFDQRSALPGNRLVEVRFGDLQDSPMEVLDEIYQKLEIDGFDEAAPHFRTYLESVAGYRKNALEISSEERKKVSERWGEFFERLDYKGE